MVKLNVCFHGCLEGDDVDETNLWFDVDANPQDLLDAMDGETYEQMTKFLSICYDESDKFYRMIDDESVELVGDKSNHNLTDALGYDEWHVDIDWDNGHYFCLSGSGFDEEMASPKVIAYLKEQAQK